MSDHRRERKEQAAFDSTTTGFGKKMLMKMGWKEGFGLGKEGEGIAKPIDVSLRPKGVGLGFIDEPDSKKAHEALYKTREAEPMTPFDKTWKKRISNDPEDIMDVEGYFFDDTPQPVKIIDMTGKDARTIDSLAEYRFHDPLSNEIFPQLIRNLRHLIITTDKQLQQAETSKAEEELKRRRHEAELANSRKMIERGTAELEYAQHLRKIILESKDASRQILARIDSAISLEALFQKGTMIEELYKTKPSIELVKIFLSMFNEPVKMLISKWDPFSEGDMLHDVMTQLSYFKFTADAADGSDVVIYNVPYQFLAKYWLPVVRTLLVNEFDPKEEHFATLTTKWYRFLTVGDLRKVILNSIIIKKVEQEIEASNNLEEFNVWAPAWTSLLAAEKETVSLVRKRLSKFFERVSVNDEAMKDHLRNWSTILPRPDFDLLLGRTIWPKLQDYLQRSLEINPSEQDIEPLMYVLEWTDVIPVDLMANILKQGLFVKLRKTLHSWMADPSANFVEITEWYLAWKSILPEGYLTNPVVSQEYIYLLVMMESLLLDSSQPVSRFS